MTKRIEKRLEKLSQHLAELYDQECHKQAEEVAEEIRELTYKHLGENHPDYATALNDLAVLYTSMGKNIEAEKLHLKALHIRQTSRGENHPDCAESFHNLAHLYDSIGNYTKAQPLYLKAIEIFRNSIGENHPHCKESMQSLTELIESIAATTKKIKQLGQQASQLSQRGEYDQALVTAKHACEIAALHLGDQSSIYATSLNNLGAICFSMSNLAEAERLSKEAVQIYSSAPVKEPSGYATCLFNLATLYRTMGNLIQAEQLFKQLAQLKAETLGENHLEYADALNHLAWLYHATARNKQAEQLYRKVIEIRSTTLDKHNMEYERSLNDLAYLYMSEGRYMEAETLYREVEEIRRTSKGEDHPLYASSLNNLEKLYRCMSKSEQADSLLRQRIDLQRKNPDLFSGAVNANDFNKSLYAQDFLVKPSERNRQYWPPLQGALAEAAVDFFNAGYSEKHKRLNKELGVLYAKGAFEEARFLLDREFSISRKALDQHEITTSISKRLKLDAIKRKLLDAMRWKNKNLWEFVSCPLLLELFCNRVEKGLLLLEGPSLIEELDLYQDAVDSMLKGGFLRRDLQAFRLFGRQRQTGSDGKLLTLEDLALASFVNKQTVFTREVIVNVLKHTSSAQDECNFKNIYKKTDLLQALSSEDYSFYNRTLHEYLTARAMYRRISDHLQGAWVDELSKFWDPACFWKEHWINVIRMFLGLLPVEKHPEFLKTCTRNLPSDLGYLEESRLKKGQPLIVMINTCYTKAAINEKIAKILGFLVETRALHYVFTEGGDGPIDRSFYQNNEKFPDDAAKKQLARAFLEKMTITGQEYLAIISCQDFHLWGIDNEALWAKLLKHLKEIALDTRDIWGGRKRNFAAYARAQSMSSTMRSVVLEREVKLSALIVGSPYFLPFPNAYEVLSARKSNREPFLLSYIKISPAGFDELSTDSDDRYKEIMQKKNLYDVSM